MAERRPDVGFCRRGEVGGDGKRMVKLTALSLCELGREIGRNAAHAGFNTEFNTERV